MRTPLIKFFKISRREDGYILVELAMLLIVIGFMFAVGVPMYKSYVFRNAAIVTENRMDIVARQISNYIQLRGRLPCPADPAGSATTSYGEEREIDLSVGPYGVCNGAPEHAYGIIPYRTLGIPEHYARDGYNNLFTYAVSPDFTADTRLRSGALRVNRRMMNLVAGDNYALMPQAQFCAPTVASGSTTEHTDLVIRDETGAILFDPNPTETPPNKRDANLEDRPTGASPSANFFREDKVTAIALAIISHGENGFGAFQGDGSQLSDGLGGSVEQETYDISDREIYVQRDFVNSISSGYDDIVKYYTQDEIFAAAGGGSCEHL